MARIGTDLTPRMVINQWVYFPDKLGVLKALPSFRNLVVPDFEKAKDCPVVGYIYVDHDAGISLKVEGLYLTESEPTAEMEAISRFVRESIGLKFRYDVIKLLDLHILNEDERTRHSLPDHPDWLRFYEDDGMKSTRECSAIDHLRAEGFFDDVHAILPTTVIFDLRSDKPVTLKPEIIWVRLKEYSETTKQFRGILLNQPYQEFGVKKNDTVSLMPMKMNGDMMLIVRK